MLRNHSGIGRILPAVVIAVGLAAFAPISGFAQGPGGKRPPLTPDQQKAMDKWKAWGESHKSVSALRMTVRGLGRLSKDPKTALTKPQAKTILGIVKANMAKPALTDAQSKQVNYKIMGVLTAEQKTVLATRPQRRGPGGGPGGPGGAPGGPGGAAGMARPGGAPGGAMLAGAKSGKPGGGGAPGGGGGGMRGGGGGMRGMMGAGGAIPEPKEYNPLNPDTMPGPAQMHDRAKKGMDELIKDLETRAK